MTEENPDAVEDLVNEATASDQAEQPPNPGWWKASDGNWYPPDSTSATPKSPDERKTLLAQTVTNQLAKGNVRVESQSDFNAILVEGKPINHTLHLILTLVTCGLWAIVWIVMALTQGEKRRSVTVDQYGNVQIQQLS